MALDDCTPCDCDPAQFSRTVENYRAAVVRILCQIFGALTGDADQTPDADFDALVSHAFGVVPAAFAAVGLVGAGQSLRQMVVYNNLDTDVELSFDGGVTYESKVVAKSYRVYAFEDNGVKLSDDPWYRYAAATGAPTEGTVEFEGLLT